jgi:hypothetical protein
MAYLLQSNYLVPIFELISAITGMSLGIRCHGKVFSLNSNPFTVSFEQK